MNTEITDTTQNIDVVLYDADCRYCIRLAEGFRPILARKKFQLAPLQAPWVRQQLGLDETNLLSEMRLLKANGEVFGGADALVEISRKYGWAWPLCQLARSPLFMRWMRAGYGWVARNRPCANGACAMKRRQRPVDFLPLVFFVAFVLVLQNHLPPWIFMWAIAFALYAGCKWATCKIAARAHGSPNLSLKLGYLFMWPGMNAAEFFNKNSPCPKPKPIEWFLAISKMALGATLLFSIAHLALPNHPLLAGWTGMLGVIFLIHFGLFHVLALFWRRRGITATPVMQNPVAAGSLANFWGTRWNTAFNELAYRFVFRPLRRRTNFPVATLAVFTLSGLIHDLVISLPARGGYGLPTLYFIIQGLGILLERTRVGITLGLGKGIRGWLFTLLVTAGPVFWLFHPPFIHNVILPMLTAIGAT